jgi:hypothetical protein
MPCGRIRIDWWRRERHFLAPLGVEEHDHLTRGRFGIFPFYSDVVMLRLAGQKLCPRRFSVMTCSTKMAGCVSARRDDTSDRIASRRCDAQWGYGDLVPDPPITSGTGGE